MRSLIYSEHAQHDLQSIHDFIALHNSKAALALVEDIHHQCLLLKEMPYIGSKRDSIAQDLRSVVVKDHLVFYLPGTESIFIVRIIHAKRDLDSQLFDLS